MLREYRSSERGGGGRGGWIEDYTIRFAGIAWEFSSGDVEPLVKHDPFQERGNGMLSSGKHSSINGVSERLAANRLIRFFQSYSRAVCRETW